MCKDNNIVSDTLNEKQEKTLMALLNLIIPPSKDGRLPGAADIDFLTYIHNEKLYPLIQNVLINVIEESHGEYDQDFSALSAYHQLHLTDQLRRRHNRFFTLLVTHIVRCYYQHDKVLEAIGLEARPPFPDGYRLEEGDLTLLEPVYKRGKIYRD